MPYDPESINHAIQLLKAGEYREKLLGLLAEAAVQCGAHVAGMAKYPNPWEDPHATAGAALDLACDMLGVEVVRWDLREAGELDGLLDDICDEMGWDFA